MFLERIGERRDREKCEERGFAWQLGRGNWVREVGIEIFRKLDNLGMKVM